MTTAAVTRNRSRRRSSTKRRNVELPKPTTFYVLAILVTILSLVGLMMVLSASSVRALNDYGDSWRFFKRQLLWCGMGAGALVITSRIPYQVWSKLARPILIVVVGLLAAVLLPGVGVKIAGAQRWIGAGSFVIQPSELAKFALIIFTADLMTRRVDLVHDWRATFRPALIATAVVGFLVMMQPDMGTTLIIGAIVLAVLFVAGTPLRAMGALMGAGIGGAFLFGMSASYRRARLLSFLNPWKDAGNSGYQGVQSLIGLGSGKIVGVGLGASTAKWGFLPNSYTDFIFSIIGEELGFIGAVAVISLFVAFAAVGVRIAKSAPDRFGALVVTGITAWVVGQAILNIGAVVGVLPVTGVPLPFVSFGGSSLMILMASVGVMMNVAAQSSRPRRRKQTDALRFAE